MFGEKMNMVEYELTGETLWQKRKQRQQQAC